VDKLVGEMDLDQPDGRAGESARKFRLLFPLPQYKDPALRGDADGRPRSLDRKELGGFRVIEVVGRGGIASSIRPRTTSAGSSLSRW
jgi:hypothetical protein